MPPRRHKAAHIAARDPARGTALVAAVAVVVGAAAEVDEGLVRMASRCTTQDSNRMPDFLVGDQRDEACSPEVTLKTRTGQSNIT